MACFDSEARNARCSQLELIAVYIRHFTVYCLLLRQPCGSSMSRQQRYRGCRGLFFLAHKSSSFVHMWQSCWTCDMLPRRVEITNDGCGGGCTRSFKVGRAHYSILILCASRSPTSPSHPLSDLAPGRPNISATLHQTYLEKILLPRRPPVPPPLPMSWDQNTIMLYHDTRIS